MKTSSSAQRNLALQPHLVLVSSAVLSDGQMQRLAIVQLTCSSQIQYQRDAGQRSFKHIILRTEICRAAASSRPCQLSRAGLSVSLYTCHVWYPYMRCSSVYLLGFPHGMRAKREDSILNFPDLYDAISGILFTVPSNVPPPEHHNRPQQPQNPPHVLFTPFHSHQNKIN